MPPLQEIVIRRLCTLALYQPITPRVLTTFERTATLSANHSSCSPARDSGTMLSMDSESTNASAQFLPLLLPL